MLVHAAYAPDHTDGDRAQTLANPNVAHYIAGWPRITDIGAVAAVENGGPVGAAWLRSFTEAEPAVGSVRADIPELATGIVQEWRGRGVGRALLRAAAESGRRRGIEHISLSVHRANPAAALYRSEGY